MSDSSVIQQDQSQCPACVNQDISVSAESPDQMASAQSALIAWAKWKVQQCTDDHLEASESFEHAKAHKWRTEPLQRMADKAKKRLEFFEKILSALEHGYTIIPNFPVTAFAIRTDKSKPLKLLTTEFSWQNKHTQNPPLLPEGQGEYKNPFPLVLEQQLRAPTATEKEIKEYWAEEWREFEFPITMAKPQMMAAATRAMALKLFDDLGVLPGQEPGSGTRPPAGDPIIVARIYDKSRCLNPWMRKTAKTSDKYRYVTFLIGWHLNTRDI